jgi:hypothetical protein
VVCRHDLHPHSHKTTKSTVATRRLAEPICHVFASPCDSPCHNQRSSSRLGSRSARARVGGDDLGGADMAKQIGATRKDQVAWRKGREMVLVSRRKAMITSSSTALLLAHFGAASAGKWTCYPMLPASEKCQDQMTSLQSCSLQCCCSAVGKSRIIGTMLCSTTCSPAFAD